MKSFLKVLSIFITAAFLFSAVSCSSGTDSSSSQDFSLSITAEKEEIYVGETVTLKARVIPKNESNAAAVFTWTSSDVSVATVSQSGTVTGVKAGKVTIYAKYNGKSIAKSILVKQLIQADFENGATKGVSVGTENREFFASNTTDESSYTVLVWSDEFEGTSLKTENWKYEEGNGNWGWGNGEKQFYTAGDNCSVEDGALHIVAKKDDSGKYTSTRIISADKKHFKYGIIECRLKADEGKGSWPAFWMLGNGAKRIWPNCGEIDIMEHANEADYFNSTLHWNYKGMSDTSEGHGEYGTKSASGFDITDWHVYKTVWTEDSIKTYVDEVPVFSMGIGNSSNGTDAFNDSFYFIINFAMGGKNFVNVEDINSFTNLPWDMYVDYIRVYQDANHVVDGASPVLVTNISLTGSDTVTAGETITLSAAVTPNNASNKEVTWTSSDTTVATVSETGVVTAVKAGTATITCTAADGSGVNATKTITVNAKPSSGSSANSITLNGKTYSLVWSDEFTEADPDGTPLSSKWGYDVGAGTSMNTDGTNPGNWAWGNSELQWYSDNDPDNTYVSDGTLKIVAKKETSNGMSYTSGRIVTRNIEGGQFKYGYIEMSAKIPADAGVWPAFWMLDNDIYDNPNPESWPGSGEIDIMESSINLWGANKVYGTLHCTAGSGGSPVFTQETNVSFSDGDFHTYAVDWDDDHIDWYYDGEKKFTYTPANYENDAWPFCDDFYIILNLAVGGNLGGSVPENFVSSTMEVDYVRVYQKTEGYTDKSGAYEDKNQPASASSKTIPSGAYVIYDSASGTNKITNANDVWNGGFGTSDCTLNDGKTVKQVRFASLKGENACGSMDISSYSYADNAKLCMSVYAGSNFTLKPVNPNVVYSQTVSSPYTWQDIEIDLGSANALTQLGFISTTIQTIWVDHIYITTTSSSGSGDSGSGGSSGSDSGNTGDTGNTGGTSTVNWSSVDYAGDGAGGGSYGNKYKFYCATEKVSLVNIQQPGFGTKPGLYVTFPAAITECSLGTENYAKDGAGILLYIDSFTKKETQFTVTYAGGQATCYVYYEDGVK